MRLTKLEIHGFKSFADHTQLVFEPGATMIVGPNGCGKSNVSDSVRWVLGEQRARVMRGGSMQDIIFQGSSARRPVNVAEVSLHFDNADGTLPVPFQEMGAFNAYAWQFLWFMGLWLGASRSAPGAQPLRRGVLLPHQKICKAPGKNAVEGS